MTTLHASGARGSGKLHWGRIVGGAFDDFGRVVHASAPQYHCLSSAVFLDADRIRRSAQPLTDASLKSTHHVRHRGVIGVTLDTLHLRVYPYPQRGLPKSDRAAVELGPFTDRASQRARLLVLNGVMEKWVDTDVFGRVVDTSAVGATFFNLSVRGLIGRDLRLFFLERQPIIEGLRAARGGQASGNIGAAYRPMEKRARRAQIELCPLNDGVRWYLADVADPAVVPPRARGIETALSPAGADAPRVGRSRDVVGPREIDTDRVQENRQAS